MGVFHNYYIIYMSTEELIAEIETLPKECIPKPAPKARAWANENSLMKCKPLHLGKRSWTRDELYER